jgi:hypothetical protein
VVNVLFGAPVRKIETDLTIHTCICQLVCLCLSVKYTYVDYLMCMKDKVIAIHISNVSPFGGVMVCVLAIGSKVHRFKPSWEN